MTSVSSASKADFLTSSLVIPGQCNLVVAERSGRRRVLGVSKPRRSAKGAHPYRKRACLEALRLATIKRTQRRTGYPSWGHPTQLRISRASTGLITDILDKTDGYKRKWLLHLQSMPQNRIPFKSYHYRPQGKRTTGRPKKRWRETEWIKGNPWCLWWWWWWWWWWWRRRRLTMHGHTDVETGKGFQFQLKPGEGTEWLH